MTFLLDKIQLTGLLNRLIINRTRLKLQKHNCQLFKIIWL